MSDTTSNAGNTQEPHESPNRGNTPNEMFDYVDDYKSKVQYLKDHLTRLWTRFNFFLTLQSALFGVSILATEKYHWGIPLFGILLCIFWYIFGVQDRYLVELYRKQIELAWKKVQDKYKFSEDSEKYSFIGQTENLPNDNLGVQENFYQKRFENFSTTKLAAIFPIFIAAVWIIVLVSFYYLRQVERK